MRKLVRHHRLATALGGAMRLFVFEGVVGGAQVVFEAFGVDEAADGVAGEVAESQGDAA